MPIGGYLNEGAAAMLPQMETLVAEMEKLLAY
jgi:hypothetical protein